MERVIAYIDGFNLYYGLRERKWKRYYWLDPRALATAILKPGQYLEGVKYFTARIESPPHDRDKARRQNVFLEAIGTLPQTSIFYGHYLVTKQRCLACGAEWRAPEEKMTDVNIAVELLTDAADDRFDTALLVSADSDLTAPITAVRSRHPKKRIVVVFPPKRHSAQLQSVATASLTLGRRKLAECQFPDEVVKPDGFVLRRPAKWT